MKPLKVLTTVEEIQALLKERREMHEARLKKIYADLEKLEDKEIQESCRKGQQWFILKEKEAIRELEIIEHRIQGKYTQGEINLDAAIKDAPRVFAEMGKEMERERKQARDRKVKLVKERP